MDNRFLPILSIFLFCNIFSAPLDLFAESTALIESTNPEKEALDVNQINSSVDAGSFYSVDVSIKLLEDNMLKMAQEMKRLKQHVELAKQTEQKHAAQVQKLEQENAKLCRSWLDNSITGSSTRLEGVFEPNSSDFKAEGLKPDSAPTQTLAQAEQSQPSPVLHEIVIGVVGGVAD